ncbi:unnamed protein product, partial [Rotaria sp. Silwood2]
QCETISCLLTLFHNQYDELRLLIHFLKHPFILHDLNNLELLLDIINLIFSKNGKDPNNINNTNSMTSSKDSLITSNTDKDFKKRLNGTQFGIYGNNPSMMKFIGK